MDGSKIAAFDFDGTLTRRDSFVRFCIFARGRRRFVAALLAASPWLAAWKAGIIPGGRAKQRLFCLLFKGMAESDFRKAGRRFIPELERIARPEMLDELRRRQAEGCSVYIVTASMAAWIAPWAESKGIDSSRVLGTEPAIGPDRRLTGRFAGQNCVGAEKVRRLSAATGCRRIAYAYGNSPADDGPLLAMAEHPCLLG